MGGDGRSKGVGKQTGKGPRQVLKMNELTGGGSTPLDSIPGILTQLNIGFDQNTKGDVEASAF
eukprot:5211993-Amphidinium_carterae.1